MGRKKPKRPSYKDSKLRDASIREMQKAPHQRRTLFDLIKKAVGQG